MFPQPQPQPQLKVTFFNHSNVLTPTNCCCLFERKQTDTNRLSAGGWLLLWYAINIVLLLMKRRKRACFESAQLIRGSLWKELAQQRQQTKLAQKLTSLLVGVVLL